MFVLHNIVKQSIVVFVLYHMYAVMSLFVIADLFLISLGFFEIRFATFF